MKKFKKIIIWSLLSIVIQLSVLLYINNILLATDSNKITSKQLSNTIKQEEPKVEIIFPKNSKGVTVSFDGNYSAYYYEDILYLINNKTGEPKKITGENTNEISFYKWLPDRNRMLIVEKVVVNNKLTIKMYYYDVDKEEKAHIKDIPSLDIKSEVEDITLSTLTNVIYIKIKESSLKSSIYWLNIMKDMKKIDTKNYSLGNMEVIPHEDKLVYEDLTNNKIRITNILEPLNFKNSSKLALLGIDGDDKIYVGVLEDSKVTKIYYGLSNESNAKWLEYPITNSVDKNDIFIGYNGSVFVNDALKGTITEKSNEKIYNYKGKFLQIYQGGIASVSEDKLVLTPIN